MRLNNMRIKCREISYWNNVFVINDLYLFVFTYPLWNLVVSYYKNSPYPWYILQNTFNRIIQLIVITKSRNIDCILTLCFILYFFIFIIFFTPLNIFIINPCKYNIYWLSYFYFRIKQQIIFENCYFFIFSASYLIICFRVFFI